VFAVIQKVFDFSEKHLYENVKISPSAILEESLKRVCAKALTDLQKRILLYIVENEHIGMTCSRHVREISKTMDLPESTVKWSIRSLRDAYLIEGGSRSQKGIPAKVTYSGLLVAEGLKGGTIDE
jgi:predicted transcriptional regulator